MTGEPAPASAVPAESFTVTGLSASTTYYFAIKTSDEVPNTSGLSNIASATTITPVVPTVQFTSAASSNAESVTNVSLPVALSVSAGQPSPSSTPSPAAPPPAGEPTIPSPAAR